MEDTQNKLTLEEREEVLVKVEELMVYGVMRASVIAKEVGCSIPTADKYIKAIKKRWEVSKNMDWNEIRIEQIEKLRQVEIKLWESYEKADNTSAELGILRTLMDVHKQEAWLGGVNSMLGS